jgi:monoamine oxidase
MARTPLFRALERTLRAAHRAGHAGADPEIFLLRPQEPQGRIITRRDFLKTSGAAALGVGLLGCDPRGGSGDPEVVIVGAGIAGLTAGWRLTQAGVGVRILEAQERIGGRMFSLRDHFPSGQVAELGGELIDTGHVHIRRLAAELGLELEDLRDGEDMVEETWYFRGRRINDAELLEAWGPVAARIQADLDALPLPEEWPWITWDAPAGAEALDRLSLGEWLLGVEMDGWFRDLLDVGFTTEFGLEAEEQSTLNLHTLIDTNPDELVIYGESDERFHVKGGNDGIPRALAQELAPWIERGVRLESVRQRGDGGFDLSVTTGGSSRTVRATHLLLAIPFTLLREVDLQVELPEVKTRAIAELGYGTNAKLMMGFRERVWRERHGSNGSTLTDLPFQLTWETSRKQLGGEGILTNFTGGRYGAGLGEGSPAERAGLAVSELERIFPGLEAAHDPDLAVRFHWPTHPWTRASYACYRPGQWTGIAGAEGMPVGRLYFAGEHCSLHAQGYMEGGCETGERAAGEILQALGRG